MGGGGGGRVIIISQKQGRPCIFYLEGGGVINPLHLPLEHPWNKNKTKYFLKYSSVRVNLTGQVLGYIRGPWERLYLTYTGIFK